MAAGSLTYRADSCGRDALNCYSRTGLFAFRTALSVQESLPLASASYGPMLVRSTMRTMGPDNNHFAIRAEHVSRHYHMGETLVRAVDGVSLSIEKREFTALLGSSG